MQKIIVLRGYMCQYAFLSGAFCIVPSSEPRCVRYSRYEGDQEQYVNIMKSKAITFCHITTVQDPQNGVVTKTRFSYEFA